MLQVPVYNQSGEKTGEVELNPTVFGVAAKPAVVHQVVTAMQSNQRQVLAHTKDRGDVRGGGKKPWKQKGTGRARHSSIRSPLWRGGGITFGPRSDRNFKSKINKKMKQRAVVMVLSDKVSDQKIIVLESLAVEDGKTKTMNTVLKAILTKVANTKTKKPTSLLLVTEKVSSETVRSMRNIPHVSLQAASSLNLLEIMRAKYVLVEKEALGIIEKAYSAKKV